MDQRPGGGPVVGTVKLKAGNIPEVSMALHETPDGVHHATLIDAKDPNKKVTYPVVRTYGGRGWKQRYQVKIGDSHYILPIQWNQATSRWVPYNLQYWYNEDGSFRVPALDRSFEAQCLAVIIRACKWKRPQPANSAAPMWSYACSPESLAADRFEPSRNGEKPTILLTCQEKRVLTLLAEALSNKEIAAELGISPCTVKRHLENILRKLDLKNRVYAAIYAVRNAHALPKSNRNGEMA